MDDPPRRSSYKVKGSPRRDEEGGGRRSPGNSHRAPSEMGVDPPMVSVSLSLCCAVLCCPATTSVWSRCAVSSAVTRHPPGLAGWATSHSNRLSNHPTPPPPPTKRSLHPPPTTIQSSLVTNMRYAYQSCDYIVCWQSAGFCERLPLRAALPSAIAVNICRQRGQPLRRAAKRVSRDIIVPLSMRSLCMQHQVTRCAFVTAAGRRYGCAVFQCSTKSLPVHHEWRLAT
jgi:hypothetical protein